MDTLIELGVFSAKVIVLVVGVVAVLITIASLAMKSKDQKPLLTIENLSKKFKKYKKALQAKILDDKALKELKKQDKKEAKADKKASKEDKKNIYVLDFEGDIKASAVDQLRNEISAVLTVATPKDEVVIRLESPGGMVHSYGLASAQLLRIRDKQIPLTVCVDKVAASGGYMMACIANKIVGAPFAVFGSIGVLAQIPNFNRVLKKHDIDYQEIKAGEYKRTLSLFGEITEKGKQKFLEEIELTHQLFKDWVSKHRPSLDITSVATGETWYGLKALNNNLIDEISTSDQYLMDCCEDCEIYLIKSQSKQSLVDKILHGGEAATTNIIEKFLYQKRPDIV